MRTVVSAHNQHTIILLVKSMDFRIPGNSLMIAELSMTWREGKLTGAVIMAHSDYDAYVIYGTEKKEVSLKAGESIELQFANAS